MPPAVREAGPKGCEVRKACPEAQRSETLRVSAANAHLFKHM